MFGMGAETLEGLTVIQLFSRECLDLGSRDPGPKRERGISPRSAILCYAATRNVGCPGGELNHASTIGGAFIVKIDSWVLLFSACFFSSIPQAVAQAPKEPRETLLLVVGAPGAAEFEEEFLEAAEQWEKLAEARNKKHTLSTTSAE